MKQKKEKKFYVLDTNVLLCDSNAMFSFEEHDVLIPLIVLEELDRHKDRQDDVGREAREVARKLRDLLSQEEKLTKSGIDTPGGGKLFLYSIEDVSTPTVVPAISAELELKSGDNQILRFCRGVQHKHTTHKDNVILVTRDTLLMVKAKALGICCETYKKMQVTRDSSTIYTGVESFCEIPNFNFALAYAGGMTRDLFLTYLTDEQKEFNWYPNMFLTVKSGESQSILLRYLSDELPLKVVGKPAGVGKLTAKNQEQKFALDLLLDPKVKLVSLVGMAGTGKTLLAIAAGLEQTSLGSKQATYNSLVVSRPVQPMGADIGFLPGTISEKMEPWLAPIKDNLRFLLSDGKKTKAGESTLDILFERGTIEVEALTYIRGRSIANAFMIIDEAQNLSAAELKTIITRVGEGTKIVLTGDIEQIDNLSVDSTSNGLTVAVERFKTTKLSGHVTLIKGERSELASLAASIL
jgi:PhoH-like ATPase